MGELGERLARFDPTAPLEAATGIPADWYLDPTIAAAERRLVFATSWQPAARIDQLRRRGDYVTADIADEPVALVVGGDEIVAGVSNVCRHRAAALLTSPCGNADRLRCGYHGWTYDLSGQLLGAPECDLTGQGIALPRFAVASWSQFVFVRLDEDGPTLERTLGSLIDIAPRWDLDQLVFFERREYGVECNWKVYVDNYLDGGYHVHRVHPDLGTVLDYSQYRTDLEEWSSLQRSPLTPADSAAGQVRGGEEALYAWVFPNWMVNLYQGVMDTNWVLPDGPARCRVIFDFYFDRRRFDDQQCARSIAVADQIQREDMEICAQAQRGLSSRYYTPGRYCPRREAGVFHFHRLLADRLKAA